MFLSLIKSSLKTLTSKPFSIDSLCNAPGVYKECQTFIPNTTYYLTGQTVSYTISVNQNLKLVGDPVRKCQPGGKWSGKPPVCAASNYLHI